MAPTPVSTTVLDLRFGLALENFTSPGKAPSVDAILAYAELAERLGFQSLWTWDHILLGAKRAFPVLESLSTLAALAVRTRSVSLGTAVLVLPLRDPVVLAKVVSTIDQLSGGRLVLGVAAGWYAREFEACGVRLEDRGRLFERHLRVLQRFLTEPVVDGSDGPHVFKRATMLPRAVQAPRPPILIGGYVDAALRRVATLSDGWLTYFYRPDSFARSWSRIAAFAEEAGRDPGSLQSVSQLPICVAGSFEEADGLVRGFINEYFDVAPWSESTADSAIRGTAQQCAEQIAAHVEAGVRHIVFVPWAYHPEQLAAISRDVLPLVDPGRTA